MFFLIAGIVFSVVLALAIYRLIRHFDDIGIFTGIVSGAVAVIMLSVFFLQVGDKCSIQRQLDAYIKDGYQFGIHRVIAKLEYRRAWADTPFSLWTNEEIDKDLKEARQVYRLK